jgi:hypothetical protein
MNTRLNDALSTISADDEEKPVSGTDLVKRLLGGVAMAGIAGKLGGTAGVNAVGGFFQNRAAQDKQRKLERINRAKRVIEGEQARMGLERDEQSIAESKARVKQAEDNAAGTKKWREDMASNQFYRDAGGNVAKVVGSLSKMMTPGKGGSGKAPKEQDLPKLPTGTVAPASTDPEEVAKWEALQGNDYAKWGNAVAKMLHKTAGISTLEEFEKQLPALLKIDQFPTLTEPQRDAAVREMKMYFANISRPDLFSKMQQFRRDKQGVEPPPPEFNRWESLGPSIGGTVGGLAGGLAGGPAGAVAGGAFGGMVGREIGRSVQDGPLLPLNKVVNDPQDMAREAVKLAMRRGKTVSGGAR